MHTISMHSVAKEYPFEARFIGRFQDGNGLYIHKECVVQVVPHAHATMRVYQLSGPLS
jgi:hypothetical protein